MLQELVPLAALHGTSALSGLPESLRAAWVKAPLVQLLQSHEHVIQGRSSLPVPAAHQKSHSYVGENLVLWHRFFRNKKHFSSIAGLVKTVLKRWHHCQPPHQPSSPQTWQIAATPHCKWLGWSLLSLKGSNYYPCPQTCEECGQALSSRAPCWLFLRCPMFQQLGALCGDLI